ncbi:MAG: hypothetical protein LAO07_14315 [Acidobacteriia bacterium]|nr:hypothetical protein [Terriglobia bacterium]
MKILGGCILSLALLAPLAAAQSLGDLARQERKRKAQQQPAVSVETDELRKGKVELTPPLDPARKGDLEYLLRQLSRPIASPELLAAFVPLKEQAVPRLIPMLGSADPVKRVAPATVLTVLGNSEGLAAMARMLDESIAAAPSSQGKGEGEKTRETFPEKLAATREAGLALNATRLGVWRFTEGSAMTPDQVVQRLKASPPIEVVGGPDNGQRIFNRALRDADGNLRLGAIALVRVASGGKDFGFQADRPPEQNESAIQEITTFLTTERAKVMSALAAKR